MAFSSRVLGPSWTRQRQQPSWVLANGPVDCKCLVTWADCRGWGVEGTKHLLKDRILTPYPGRC